MSKKIIIIGGVAGGASCATRLRRNDEDASITIYEKGPYVSFANCGLPYHIGNVIKSRDALLINTPEALKNKFNLDVKVNHEVIKIDRDNKQVEVRNLESGEIFTDSYDKLVVSTGSSPLRPPIPGIDGDNIFSLWDIPDMDVIIENLDKVKSNHATVIGGGFIGVEVAENLVDRGFDVSLIELSDQVMPPFDFEMAQILHRHMNEKGIELILSNGVKSFESSEDNVKITTNNGEVYNTSLVVLSIGVKPNSNLIKECGLELNSRGGVVVDEKLQTADKDIFAIGDVAEVTHVVNGQKTMIPLAGPANKMGRIAADIIAGKEAQYKGSMGSSVVKVFDLTAACVGLNEKSLERSGLVKGKDYITTVIHPKSHAGYYPGAMGIDFKIIYDPNGKILGAQAVGFEGVDKRIDVLASVIKFGGTVYDLTELELCYAPPYSSAKDPVNMLGYVAENLLTHNESFIDVTNLETNNDTIILDVRRDAERMMGSIEGSIHIPLAKLRENIDKLDKNKNIVVYCAVGLTSHSACRILKQKGFDKVYNLSGGYTSYRINNYKINSQLKKASVNKTGQVKEDTQEDSKDDANVKVIQVDACGMQCPGPALKLHEAIKDAKSGDVIEIQTTDSGFFADVEGFCNSTGHTLIKNEQGSRGYVSRIRIAGKSKDGDPDEQTGLVVLPHDKTMVVFSNDFDKAIASFIIANGAASMGREVTMFFTFWGINILRKRHSGKVSKNLIEKMFGAMMPKGSSKLKLSKMNMAGMGKSMIKGIMRKKNVLSLEELIQTAIKNGVKMVVCTMSMDLMGIKKEELIDGVEFGGVVSYLDAAEQSDVNLFI